MNAFDKIIKAQQTFFSFSSGWAESKEKWGREFDKSNILQIALIAKKFWWKYY